MVVDRGAAAAGIDSLIDGTHATPINHNTQVDARPSEEDMPLCVTFATLPVVGGLGTPGYQLPPPPSSSQPYFFARPHSTSAASVDPFWCVRLRLCDGRVDGWERLMDDAWLVERQTPHSPSLFVFSFQIINQNQPTVFVFVLSVSR